MEQRFKKALIFCGLFLAMCLFFGLTAGFIAGFTGCSNTQLLSTQSSPNSTYASKVWSSIKQGADFSESLRQAGFRTAKSDSFPSWFSSEIMDVSQSAEIYANADMNTVAISIKTDSKNPIFEFMDTLVQKGWNQFDTGYPKTKDSSVFGKGVASLCEGVRELGSLNAAAKKMGMAYSKAWRIVKDTESSLGFKLLDRDGAHGSELTKEGDALLDTYVSVSEKLSKEATKLYEKSVS